MKCHKYWQFYNIKQKILLILFHFYFNFPFFSYPQVCRRYEVWPSMSHIQNIKDSFPMKNARRTHVTPFFIYLFICMYRYFIFFFVHALLNAMLHIHATLSVKNLVCVPICIRFERNYSRTYIYIWNNDTNIPKGSTSSS